VTPLSDALTAAQRSALAALEKAYVAGQIDEETMAERLKGCGITDSVDIDFLTVSLNVLREWGVSAPTMSERVAEAKVETASDKQWALIRRLCEEKAVPVPDQALTKAEASEAITAIQNGSYDPEKWAVPF
jgi:hypothetical protein